MKKALAALVLIAAACSSGKAKAPTSTSTTSAAALGTDQKNSVFCQDLIKINNLGDPTAHAQQIITLFNDAAQHAPASLKSDVETIARLLAPTLNTGTTQALNPSDQAALAPAAQALGTYATQHCGISVTTG